MAANTRSFNSPETKRYYPLRSRSGASNRYRSGASNCGSAHVRIDRIGGPDMKNTRAFKCNASPDKRRTLFLDLIKEIFAAPFTKKGIINDDGITEGVIFSVASSQEGGIDIGVGSSTMHMQKHCSVHHPVVQMVLLAQYVWQDTFCCPHSMVPKAILDIIKKARSDACSTDIPTVYEAGWVHTKSHSTKSPNEDAISHIKRQKVDRQTDMSNWLSLPVLFDASIKSETLISKVPGSNKTQEYGSTVNAGTVSVVGPLKLRAPLKCKVEDLVCSLDVNPSINCMEQSGCWLGDCNVPKLLSDTLSNPIESIGSTQFASSNTGTVSDSMQLYCRPDGSVNSVGVQDPEGQQYILKNPGNEQNDLPCALYQPIHCSTCPDASEVLIGNMKLAHLSLSEGAPLNSSGYSEERRDSKMYALVTPQSRRAGDGGSSSTGTPVRPLWLDSGAIHHMVGDDKILTNLRDPPAGMVVTVANGSQLPVTKVGDIKTPDIEITDVYLVPGLKMDLVSVRQLVKSKIVTTFYENHAELWLEGRWIGHAIIDDAGLLYRLCFLQAPCLKERGIGIRVGSSTMHMPKHCSVRAGAPLNSSGYGDSKMYALRVLPQSLRAGDGASSSTGTPVGPLWLDSGATHHFVGDDRILTNLRDLPAGMVVTVANGSQLPVTKVGDIKTPDIEITDVYLVPGLQMCLVSVRQLAKSKIVTTFYEDQADLWLEGSWIGCAIIDNATWLYRLHFLQAPCLREGGIGIRVGSSTMHMPKHCSVSEGAPLNSSGYGDSKMYALRVLPQSLRAGDGASSSTGTPVGPLWLDSGATHHFVGDDRILTNLRDLPAGMVVTVANGSQLPVTKVGDIQTPDIEIKDVYLAPGLEMNLVSVRLLTKSKIDIIFYENHAELLLQRSEIGGAIIDDAAWLYRLRYLYDV